MVGWHQRVSLRDRKVPRKDNSEKVLTLRNTVEIIMEAYPTTGKQKNTTKYLIIMRS